MFNLNIIIDVIELNIAITIILQTTCSGENIIVFIISMLEVMKSSTQCNTPKIFNDQVI